MNKYCILVIFIICSSLILSACKMEAKSPIKYQRKLEKYLNPNGGIKKAVGGVVDLSEGPRLNYNSKFGPKELNFDIKIVNPY